MEGILDNFVQELTPERLDSLIKSTHLHKNLSEALILLKNHIEPFFYYKSAVEPSNELVLKELKNLKEIIEKNRKELMERLPPIPSVTLKF